MPVLKSFCKLVLDIQKSGRLNRVKTFPIFRWTATPVHGHNPFLRELFEAVSYTECCFANIVIAKDLSHVHAYRPSPISAEKTPRDDSNKLELDPPPDQGTKGKLTERKQDKTTAKVT